MTCWCCSGRRWGCSTCGHPSPCWWAVGRLGWGCAPSPSPSSPASPPTTSCWCWSRSSWWRSGLLSLHWWWSMARLLLAWPWLLEAKVGDREREDKEKDKDRRTMVQRSKERLGDTTCTYGNTFLTEWCMWWCWWLGLSYKVMQPRASSLCCAMCLPTLSGSTLDNTRTRPTHTGYTWHIIILQCLYRHIMLKSQWKNAFIWVKILKISLFRWNHSQCSAAARSVGCFESLKRWQNQSWWCSA